MAEVAGWYAGVDELGVAVNQKLAVEGHISGSSTAARAFRAMPLRRCCVLEVLEHWATLSRSISTGQDRPSHTRRLPSRGTTRHIPFASIDYAVLPVPPSPH
jgi:hypothetical protein